MKTRVETPQRHRTDDGRTVYAMCIQAFPGFFANVYLIDDGSALTLVDCGSGMDGCNEDLTAAFGSLEESFGRRVGLSDVDAIVVTHGHMDHFGGVSFLRGHTDAPVGIHTLDRRVLSHYEERVVVASQQLAVFLERCGLSESARQRLLHMYMVPKERYRSMPVDFLLREGSAVTAPTARGEVDLGLEVLHVPGHSPGLVCLRLGDLLLTADHVLARITPHQAPESITLHMGLSHYFDSLAKVRDLEGVRLGLGGHEEPIEDLAARVDAIRASHDERLGQVLDACAAGPTTTAEVSRALFGELHGYNVLLGLEEAAAHVEYLHIHGELVADNLDEIQEGGAVVRYVRPD